MSYNNNIMEGASINVVDVANQCRELGLKSPVELNNYIVNCETMNQPKNYKDDQKSLSFYVGVMILLQISPNSKFGKEMFVLRDRLRKSRIEDIFMKNMGFVFSDTIEEYPEGHEYEQLYTRFVNEKNKVRKELIGDMILITQKKWKSEWGYFPKRNTIKSYLKTARTLINES